METTHDLPLSNIKVVEFSHMVMGPSAGLVLADMGADVLKVEPVDGDKTRLLRGSGAGYFAMYNRNKRSIRLNLKSPEGLKVARELCRDADVLIENFRPGAMDRLGLDYASLSADNPRLVYCSARGFLAGPYEHRTALDEVAQRMRGLAYMTGPTGRPLRAGASVIDVMGGMFGVIAIQGALEERHRTGRGQQVKSSLFESTAFLVGQHMAQYSVTGQPAAPMPERISAWAIYDVFSTKDEQQVFVGVVSDSQWKTFCTAFEFTELAANSTYELNNARVDARDAIMPIVREKFATMTKEELMAKLETIGLPFAPITKPNDLFEDEHLTSSNGLLDVTLDDGTVTHLPALPIEMGAGKFAVRRDLPASGEHTREVLINLGYSAQQITQMEDSGAVSSAPCTSIKGVPKVG